MQQSEILDVVAQLWKRYPDWRFGQLVMNIATLAGSTSANVEDAEFLESAMRYLTLRGPEKVPDDE